MLVRIGNQKKKKKKKKMPIYKYYTFVDLLHNDFMLASKFSEKHGIWNKSATVPCPMSLGEVLYKTTKRGLLIATFVISRHDQMTNQGHLDQISLYCVDGGHPCISNVNTAFQTKL